MLEFVILLLLAAIVAVLVHVPWRRRFVSDRILAVYRRMVPSMSTRRPAGSQSDIR